MIQRLEQWLRSEEGIQRYKRFQIEFSGRISKEMSRILLRNATNVRSSKRLKKYQVNFITEVIQQISTNICSLPEVARFKHFRLYRLFQ